MKTKWLHKAIPLTLSAGMVLGVPAMMPQLVPESFVAQAIASKAQPAAQAKDASWDFRDGMDGWKYGGKWDYKGEPVIEASKEHGGTVKLGVNYAENKDSGWSEVKLEYGKTPLDVTGANTVSYDLYYQPSAMTGGQFKTKVYAKDTKDEEVINVAPDIDLSQAKKAGKGWNVVHVAVQVPDVKAPLSYFMVSIVGSNTDYTGDLYLGHMRVNHTAVADGYVDVKTSVRPQAKLGAKALPLPTVAPLVDKDATARTAQTYAMLRALAATDNVAYGHQNEMHRKVSPLPGHSDTYDMVRDDAAIVGVDGLALTGAELELTDAERAAGETYSAKLARLVLPAVKEGAVLTMSCHMPNFAEVAKRPKVDGRYDYTGYSPNHTEGDVVQRILPGGDLRDVYTGYLDLVADFLSRMQAADVPVIFRPFHENNGSWFWWGAAHCTPSEFKNLYRSTVEYLRDEKGLHNLLYAYSPNGPIADAADYAARYPGDAFIDITGVDMYHRDPQKDDSWMAGFDKTLAAVDDFADRHDKLAAVTEAGILVGNTGGALAKTGNQRPDWFREVLKTVAPHKMAYFMTWSNFNEGNFDEPYLVTPKRGHEMVNSFIDFYNEPQSVFAKQMPDVSKIAVKTMPAADTYGYLTSPGTATRILSPTTVRARVAGKYQKAEFLLKRKDGTVIATLPATAAGDGVVTGSIPASALQAAGQMVGTVELALDGKTADSVMVLFNMPEPAKDPALVDDFESYYDDGGLLKAAYSTNCGAGCTVEPLLTATHAGGETGLDFHYTINKGGYAGIVRSLGGADWSSYDAVQFWLKPDGRGQKLICQLNSNGEDFEVNLTNLAKTTQPQLVTLPFAQFKGKNGGTFDRSAVQHFAIYCNTIGDEAVDSHFYFDDIRAVQQEK